MKRRNRTESRRAALVAMLGGAATVVGAQRAWAQSPDNLKQPVYRVANTKIESERKPPEHPLDPAIEMAQDGLRHIRSSIRDYTATLVKRERIKGKLNDYEYMFVKVRNRQTQGGKITVPFSVYMYFLKPASIKGRECVYVEGENNNKLCAHEGGNAGKLLPTVWLKPDSALAMRGQLYPITDIGIESLVLKLIERGERERRLPDCEVTFHKNAKVNGRVCTMLQVKHPVKRPEFEFYVAQVFIDDQWNVPIRYAAYDWPKTEGGRPETLEEYTYVNLKLNVGLKDADFDTKNPNYNF